MAVARGIMGDETVVEDKAVAISIKRYNELIKKEVLFDELSKNSDTIVLLSAKPQQVDDEWVLSK